jgi:hypothetical protein
MLAIEIAQLQASPSEVRPCARTPKADDRNLR